MIKKISQLVHANKCQQSYICSTIRFLHDRVKEHLSQRASSVFKHLNNCQNNVKDAINIKTIAKDTDPVNLPLKEAVYIKKDKSQLNSREELTYYFNHLLIYSIIAFYLFRPLVI